MILAPGKGSLVLASGSETRLRLLRAAGLEVTIDIPRVDEGEIKRSCRAEGLTAAATAEALAELKATRVGHRHPGALVIGADQMLECDGEWFDKPTDRATAQAQLQRLSGRPHRLFSAVVAVQNGVRVWHAVDVATLTVRPLTADFIAAYLDACGEDVLGSVGGYRLEGLGSHLFSSVAGDYFTILGLPLLPLLGFLRQRGMVAH